MNKKQTLVVIAAAASLVAGSAIAGEIYRYTDADGNVHYVDRPSGADTEQRVAISTRRSIPSASPSSGAQAQGQAAATPAEADAEAANKKKTRAEKIAEQKEHQERCASFRAKLETMVTSRRLYRENEDGERVYLDDAEIDEARARAQELVEENCS